MALRDAICDTVSPPFPRGTVLHPHGKYGRLSLFMKHSRERDAVWAGVLAWELGVMERIQRPVEWRG